MTRKPRPLGSKAAPSLSKVVQADAYLEHLRAIKGVEDDDFAFFGDDVVASTVKERIPTGSLGIDKLIGGGWPVGHVTELAAWENVGKSTICDQSIAQCQMMGAVAALIFSEPREKKYSAKLGVDINKLIVRPAESIEQGFDGIDKILDVQEKLIELSSKKKGAPSVPPILIVWDSVGGTPTQSEMDGASDDAHVMEAARNIKMNLRRTAFRIAKLRAALVLTNHFYQTIGPFASLKTYGGGAMRYFPSVRVWLTAKEKIKVGTTAIGHLIEAKLKKTRISVPRAPEEIGLVWGSGIDNSFSLFAWAKERGTRRIQHNRGAGWYYLMLPDDTYEAFQNGFIGLGEVLSRRPDVYAAMVAEYLADTSAI